MEVVHQDDRLDARWNRLGYLVATLESSMVNPCGYLQGSARVKKRPITAPRLTSDRRGQPYATRAGPGLTSPFLVLRKKAKDRVR